jgi:hypothetical protein
VRGGKPADRFQSGEYVAGLDAGNLSGRYTRNARAPKATVGTQARYRFSEPSIERQPTQIGLHAKGRI